MGLLCGSITIALFQPQKSDMQAGDPQFGDIAASAGLTVPHIASAEKKYVVESISRGVELIDCDNDGRLDIITVDVSSVKRVEIR